MAQPVSSSVLTILLGAVAAAPPVAKMVHVSITKHLGLSDKMAARVSKFAPWLYIALVVALVWSSIYVTRDEQHDSEMRYQAVEKELHDMPTRVVMALEDHSHVIKQISAKRTVQHAPAPKATRGRIAETEAEPKIINKTMIAPVPKRTPVHAAIRKEAITPTAAQSPQIVEVMPSGRFLTNEQAAVLRDRLAPLSGHNVTVYADMQDQESGAYALQFWRLFQSVGLNVGKMVGENMYSSSYSPPPILVVCITKSPFNQSAPEVQDALVLRGALVAAGLLGPEAKISVQLKPDLTGETEMVQLQIGPRVSLNP